MLTCEAIICQLEKRACLKLNDQMKKWIRKNVLSYELLVSSTECITNSLVVDVNEKNILYYQSGILYKRRENVDKNKEALILLPLTKEGTPNLVFWYIPQNNI